MFNSRRFAILGSVALFLISALAPTYHGHLQELSFLPSDNFGRELKLFGFASQFDEYFSNAVENQSCPGLAVSIIKGNTTLLEKGYGYKSSKSQELVDNHTLFRLASNSKGVASTLAGVLVNKGIIDWDDRLVDYLADFEMKDPSQADKIQLKHILSHSAGFPYHTYTNLVEARVDLKRIIQEMKDVAPIAEPGTIYSYQNAAYSLIGEVIEERTGEDIHTCLQEHLFNPLGMKDASTSYEEIINHDNATQPHVKTQKGWAAINHKNTYYNAIPAGGVNASVADMSNYLKALLGYSNELPPHILDELFTPQVSCPAKWKYFRGWSEVNNLDYGLGWRIMDFNGHKVIYHGGYVKGFRSEIAFDPEEEIAICVLTNSGSSFPKKSIRKFLSEYYAQQEVSKT